MEAITFAALAILVGVRHGMDGDHVAAIADMIGSEREGRKRISLGLMYAFGHGSIVFIIGLLSMFLTFQFSDSIRNGMEICVAVTLLILGTMIIYSVCSQKEAYEYKSRLHVLYEAISRMLTRGKKMQKERRIHPVSLGIASAFVIGIVHGIGVESPTQVALIANTSGLTSTMAATIQLVLFVLGLLIATICITLGISWGFLKAELQNRLFRILGVITGGYSLYLGIFMLLELWKEAV